MELSPHLTQVHDQLVAAAALGDDRTREIAASLATAAAPAVRLAVLSALTAAADEITAALLDHPGSPAVTVHLGGGLGHGLGSGAGGGDEVVVSVQDSAAPHVPTADPRADDGDASARISLRLAESLKNDIEAAAAKDGVSVNTWLQRAASGALQPNPFAQFGAGFAKLGGLAAGRGDVGGEQRTGQQRITGWIDG